MRKTILYIILLGVLGYGVYYFLFAKQEDGFPASEAGFAVKDTASIGKIFIAAHNGQSVLIERTDSGWVVDKRYKVMKNPIDNLMKILYLQTPLYPVPKSMHNNVVSGMVGNGIKVELDNRQGEKMRVFYVGGENKDFTGTYMLMEGAKRPYLVSKQGFQGYLAPFYSFQVTDWRDRTIFNLKPAEIKSISLQYPDKPQNSFVLNNEQEGPKLETSKVLSRRDSLNRRRANTYLKFFENVNCEGYVVGYHDVDSIMKTMPKYCSIELKGKGGQYQHLDIYWAPLTRRSKNLTAPSADVPENKYDADHFYGVMNNYRDTIMLQRFVFKKIFRTANEFYEPDEMQPLEIMPESLKK